MDAIAFEKDLHISPETLEDFDEYWALYQTYKDGWTDTEQYKVLREFSHKYLIITQETFNPETY